PDQRGEHALAGPPGRPRPRPPRPLAPPDVGARAPRLRDEREEAMTDTNGARLPSRTILEGPDRAAARAYLYGIGYTSEDLNKPIIGIANTWTETMPGNFHLRALARRVQEGIR